MVLMMTSAFALADEINVISREDGSGTRGAFVELFGIEQKNEDGMKIDYTTDECDITNSTSVLMTSVSRTARRRVKKKCQRSGDAASR